MGDRGMENLSVGDLRIETLVDGESRSLQLFWRGKSSERHPSKSLAPYFAMVLTAAGARRVPIELHFEKLEHFNSSTIATIIQFIQDARAREIKLVLVYDDALKWQRISFDALRVFAKDELLELRSA